MEFGRVPEKELKQVDFSLPQDPAFNKKVLKGKPAAKPAVYLGCAKWGRKEWVGKIYPPGTKEKDFLEHYVKHYNSIELNATHYKVYGPEVIAKWNEKAAQLEFKFAPKMAKSITHFGSLNNKQHITNVFLEGVMEFGEHLGPIFIQVSDKFSPNRKEELFNYLATLPKDLQFFVEVRHPEWFADIGARDELFEKLRSLDIGVVITDTAGRRDCAHMHLTVPKAFIRYVGNSLHPSDYTRCDAWVDRIKSWLDAGLTELYFFMHMHDEATSPELTVYLVDALNRKCGLNLNKPEFVKGPGVKKLVGKSAVASVVKESAAKGSAAKKSAVKESAGGKSTIKKSAGMESVAKESVAKESSGKNSVGRKAAGQKAAVKRSALKKSSARESTVKKSPGKKLAVRNSTDKRSAVKKSAARKSNIKKSAAKKSSAKKSTVKKSTVRKQATRR